MNTKVLKALFADKINLLLVGALALVGSGSSLNAGTTAYFTDTETLGSNVFTTADVNLTQSGLVAYSFSNLVPGDAMFKKFTIANTGTNVISVPYYMSIVQDSGDAEMSSANGINLVALRCYSKVLDTGAIDPTSTVVDCDGVTALSAELIGGTGSLHTTATAWNLTAPLSDTNVVPTGQAGGAVAGAATIAVSGQTVTGKQILTSVTCATAGAGACLMNGPNETTNGIGSLTNANLTGLTLYGLNTTEIPAAASAQGIKAGGTDKFTVVAYIPTSTTRAQLGNKTGTYTIAFTGVQPSGATSNNSTSALR